MFEVFGSRFGPIDLIIGTYIRSFRRGLRIFTPQEVSVESRLSFVRESVPYKQVWMINNYVLYLFD